MAHQLEQQLDVARARVTQRMLESSQQQHDICSDRRSVVALAEFNYLEAELKQARADLDACEVVHAQAKCRPLA